MITTESVAVQEGRDCQIAELTAKSQKLADRLEQREHELTNNIEDLQTQLQVMCRRCCSLIMFLIMFMFC